MKAHEFVELLDGVVARPGDRWSAKCPAHDDSSASLSIKEADDKVLVYCFAGCNVFDICRAAGTEPSALFHGGETDPEEIMWNKLKRKYDREYESEAWLESTGYLEEE